MCDTYCPLRIFHDKLGMCILDHSDNGNMDVQWCSFGLVDMIPVLVCNFRPLYNVDTKVFDHLDSESVHIPNFPHSTDGMQDIVEWHQSLNRECHLNTMVCSTNKYRQVYNLLHICNLERFPHFAAGIWFDQAQSKPEITAGNIRKRERENEKNEILNSSNCDATMKLTEFKWSYTFPYLHTQFG